MPDIEDSGTTMELIEHLKVYIHDGDQLALDMVNIHSIMDRVEMESVAQTRPLCDIRRVLSDLKAMELKIGLLTRSCERYAKAVTCATDSGEFFDALACRDHKYPAKPHPASLVNLANVLGVECGRILLVGDHVMDGRCAKSAGALFAAVTYGSSPTSEMKSMSAVAFLNNLDKLPDLIREINGGGNK